VGAAWLAWAYWRWLCRTSPRNDTVVPQLSINARILIIIVCLSAMMAFALPYGVRIAREDPPSDWWSVFIVKSVIASITAGFVELFVFSVGWHLRKEKAPALELEG
jgi:nicotinamide riboside transporter PnuC